MGDLFNERFFFLMGDLVFMIYLFFNKDFIYLFLERGEGKEKERERNIEVWLPLLCPQLGDLAHNQARALAGNQLVTLWFTSLHSNPRSCTSQDSFISFKKIDISYLKKVLYDI